VRWWQVFPQLTAVMVTPLVTALSRYESLKADEDSRKVSRCLCSDAEYADSVALPAFARRASAVQQAIGIS